MNSYTPLSGPRCADVPNPGEHRKARGVKTSILRSSLPFEVGALPGRHGFYESRSGVVSIGVCSRQVIECPSNLRPKIILVVAYVLPAKLGDTLKRSAKITLSGRGLHPMDPRSSTPTWAAFFVLAVGFLLAQLWAGRAVGPGADGRSDSDEIPKLQPDQTTIFFNAREEPVANAELISNGLRYRVRSFGHRLAESSRSRTSALTSVSL